MSDARIGTNRVMWSPTIGIDLPAEAYIDAAAAAGYSHTSLSLNTMRDMTLAELRAVAEYGRQRGVRTSVLDGYYSWLPISGSRVEALAATQDQLLRMIEGLGAEMVNVLSIPDCLPQDEQAEPFGELCDVLADVGVRAALEFSPLGGIHSLAGGLRLVQAADRPNGGLLFDVWHFTKSDPDRELLARTDPRWILCVQISDALMATEESLWRDTIRHRRHAGDGEFELVPLVRQLRDQGMLDWYGPEVISTAQHALDPAEAGRVAGQRLDEFLAEALG